MMFIKASSNSHGFVNARDIEDIWRDHFDYFYQEYDDFIFVSHDVLSRNMPSWSNIVSLSLSTLTSRGAHMHC